MRLEKPQRLKKKKEKKEYTHIRIYAYTYIRIYAYTHVYVKENINSKEGMKSVGIINVKILLFLGKRRFRKGGN